MIGSWKSHGYKYLSMRRLMSCYHEITTSVSELHTLLVASTRNIESWIIKTEQHSSNRQETYPLFYLETPLLQVFSDTPTSGISWWFLWWKYNKLWSWLRQSSKRIMEGGKHSSTTIAGVRCDQLWHKQPGYRRFWKNSWWYFLHSTCPQEKNEPSQNCNKWNSTSWSTKASVLITSIPIFII